MLFRAGGWPCPAGRPALAPTAGQSPRGGRRWGQRPQGASQNSTGRALKRRQMSHKKRGLLFDLKKQHFFVIGTVKSELINTGNNFLPTKTIRDIRFSCNYRLKHFKAQLTKSSIKINFWLVYGQAQLKLLYLLNCVHSHTGATPTSSVEEPEPVWRAGSS